MNTMNRRTLLTQLGIATTTLTGWNAFTDNPTKSADDKSAENPTKSSPTETDPKKSLTVQLVETTPVFEGQSVTITFAVSNPHDVPVKEPVRIDRDSWTTVYEDTLTVAPSSIEVIETDWNVRHDAAGHSMTLHLYGKTDTDDLTVSARSQFTPTIESIEESGSDNDQATVTYMVENDGSAPGMQTVTVLIDGVPQDKHDVSLGIGQHTGHDGELTHTFSPSSDCTQVSVETESSSATQQYHAE